MKTQRTAILIGLIIAFIFSLNTTTAQKTTVKLETKPGKQYPLELWEYHINSDTYKFKENLALNKQGSVEFKIPNSPNLYKIKLGNKGIEFINDNSDSIEIEIDFKTNVFPPIRVKGSKATNQYKDYLLNVADLQNKYLYPLESKMKAALESDDQHRINSVEQEHQENLKIFATTLYEQISKMGSSLALFAIIRTLDFNKYLPYIEELEKPFITERPSFPFTIKLHNMIEEAKKIQVGGVAPIFTLNRYDNNQPQSLSDFRGGIVLIDFWASWCLPCIKENIEFKDIYATFKNKGFNIWGINMDKKENLWEKAIKKYDLPWVHSRLEDDTVENMYKVVALPTNFLIDEKGKIIARNITAIELAEILNKRYK